MGDIVDQMFDKVGDTLRGAPERHVVPNCNGSEADIIDLTDVVERIDTTANYRISATNQDAVLSLVETAYHGMKGTVEEEDIVDLVDKDFDTPASEGIDDNDIHYAHAAKHSRRARASKSRRKRKKKKKRRAKSLTKKSNDDVDDDDSVVEARDDDNAFDGFIDNILDTVEYVWGPLSQDRDMNDEEEDDNNLTSNRNIHPFSTPELREKRRAKEARRKHVKNKLANKWETMGFLTNPHEKKQEQEIESVKNLKEQKSKKKKRGTTRKKNLENDRNPAKESLQPRQDDASLKQDLVQSQQSTTEGMAKVIGTRNAVKLSRTISKSRDKGAEVPKAGKVTGAGKASVGIGVSKANKRTGISKTKRDILQFLSTREQQQASRNLPRLEIKQLTRMKEVLNSVSLIIEANKCTIPGEIVTQVEGDYRKLTNTLADNKLLEMIQGDTCISGGNNIYQTLSSDCPQMNMPDAQVLNRNSISELQYDYQKLCLTLMENNVLEMIEENACQVERQDLLEQTTRRFAPGTPDTAVRENIRYRQRQKRVPKIPEGYVRNGIGMRSRVQSNPDRSVWQDFDVDRVHETSNNRNKWLVDATGSDSSVSSTETEISAALKLAHLHGAPSRGDVLDKLYESCEARVLKAANRIREELVGAE